MLIHQKETKMFHIQLLNPIAKQGLDLLGDNFDVSHQHPSPDAILVRSSNMHELEISPRICVVGRAGAGTNNIPIDALSEKGIPVLNTPGANANAVKELVLAGMLMASRHLCHAWSAAKNIEASDDKTLNEKVEKQKKQFKGQELPGKQLLVIGLGKIGVQVANCGIALDMNVTGFDPHISLENAWHLSSQVNQAQNLEDALRDADFISLHVPLNDHTRHLIDASKLKHIKPEAILINFARGPVVDEQALKQHLEDDTLAGYVCDFPSLLLRDHPKVIALPHLGASTMQAEDNCAKMIALQVKDYLERGHIKHSVNFPDMILGPVINARISIAHKNKPNMLAQISQVLSNHRCNIIDMLNKSKGDLAYTLVDFESQLSHEGIKQVEGIDGVLRVRHMVG